MTRDTTMSIGVSSVKNVGWKEKMMLSLDQLDAILQSPDYYDIRRLVDEVLFLRQKLAEVSEAISCINQEHSRLKPE